MAARWTEVLLDAHDTEALATFRAAVLGWERTGTYDEDDAREIELAPPGGDGPTMVFLPVDDPKVVKNRVHLDLRPVGCTQAEELERLLGLGARRVDVGQGEVSWVVLADPEGNEFCLLRDPPGA